MANIEKIERLVEQGDTVSLKVAIDEFLLSGTPDEQYDVSEWLAEIGYVEEAVVLLEHLQYILPDETQLIIDRANLLIELDREDDALNALMDITEDDELYPQALVSLADLFHLQGLLEAAENRLNEAIALMPGEPLLMQAKAELLLDSGRYLESAKIFQDLKDSGVELEGIDLSERLAEVYSAGAAYEEALPHYEEALKRQTGPDTVFGAAVAYFQTKQYEKTASRLAELLAADPDYFSAYLLKAQSENMLENYEAAYSTISEGIRRDEYDKEFYLFAGKLALKLGEREQAVGHLRQAIALDPEYMEAVYTLAAVFHADELDDELLELGEAVMGEGQDWTGLYPMLADAYERKEQFTEAGRYFELASPLFTDDTDFLQKYARFLIEEGKREQAIEIIRQLHRLEPDNPEWFDWLDSVE